ncbi:MAG: RecQ family ATP-dependent DNA helicase [Deltaproteobacteria bacterium]|nr:RecQ family ATP-dependent DNA helicase [Deltaproteobacteria bacterium]MBW2361580.1 RecQ family ATP-dependent DNA helicase [Deltaproteobacteria bacterium]
MPAIASLEDARLVLGEVFGHAEFRAGQGEAVQAAVAGEDALVLLPTGSGKSLCFQLPAISAFSAGRGTTLVISPLIALMQDQVDALRGLGVPAAALHSHQGDAEQQQAVTEFLRGELVLLYVSPERAAKPSFRRMLARVRIALLAIDEAHCVSQWGHDFRPDYLRIHELREVVAAPAVALTATATPLVMDEIASRLELRDPNVVRGDFQRPNLAFSVQHLRGQDARLEALRAALAADGLRSRSGAGRAIVYCSTRKATESVARALRAGGFPATHYHAGRTKLARERAHQAFAAGRSRVLVATNAFGMGVDFADVRLIVHFQTPGSLEAYYQEAGRAGRDGAPARCILFFGPGDLATQRRLAAANPTSRLIAQRRSAALEAVACYAREIRCRQQLICAHFTGSDEHAACRCCDVCLDADAVAGAQAEEAPSRPPVTELPSEATQLIVEAVDRLRRPVGKTNLARALRGSRAKSLSRGGLLTLPEYGKLAEYSEASIVAAVDALLAAGRLQKTGRKYPTLWIPGKPVRAAPGARTRTGTAQTPRRRGFSTRAGPVARALDNYRKRTARRLKWKAYMVFQRRVILAIDREQPTSRAALASIPGLGPAKIERFGDDILALVREHGGSQRDFE